MRSASPSPARAPAPRAPTPDRVGGRTSAPFAAAGVLAAVLLVPSVASAQFLRGTLGDRETATADDPTRAPAKVETRAPVVASDLLGLGETVSPLDPVALAKAAEDAGRASGSAPADGTTPTTTSPDRLGTGTIDPRRKKPAKGAAATGSATGAATDAASGATSGGPVLPVRSAAPADETRAVAPVAATQPARRDPDPKTAEEAVKEDEAYAPLGLRTGGMTWLPAVELAVGGKSNVDSARGGRSSAMLTIEPELVGRSDWSRHALEVSLRGSYFAYPNAPDQSRPSYRAETRGRIDLGDLTRVDLTGAWARQRESVSATEAASGGEGTDRETKTLGVGITRDVGRIGLTLRGEMERSDYIANGTLATGTTDPSIQNNTRWTAAFRTTLGPADTLAPFVEVQTGIRRYDARLVYGLRRDGEGAAVKAGVAIDAGPTLRGEISTGWGFERPAEPTLTMLSGWLVDERLTWSPTRLVVVKTQLKTGFEPTTNAGSPGSIARSMTVDLDWSMRRDFVASVGAGLDTKHYFGIDVDERTAMLSTGLTYKFDRTFQTFLRAKLEHVTASNAPTYDVVTVMSGIRIQR